MSSQHSGYVTRFKVAQKKTPHLFGVSNYRALLFARQQTIKRSAAGSAICEVKLNAGVVISTASSRIKNTQKTMKGVNVGLTVFVLKTLVIRIHQDDYAHATTLMCKLALRMFVLM